MKFIIQRVNSASVKIENESERSIGKGLLIYAAIIDSDSEITASKMVLKTVKMRIFQDNANKMNLSLIDKNFSCLLISQFTLYADCKRGNRPFYGNVATPNHALNILKKLENEFNKFCICHSGIFGAYMKISSENDGPVTIILDSDIL